jgi:hypothetical protein
VRQSAAASVPASISGSRVGVGINGGTIALADEGGGGGIVVVPGGDGGVCAQVWRLHPAMLYDAPYGGTPANQISKGAPFQTLNALFLS